MGWRWLRDWRPSMPAAGVGGDLPKPARPYTTPHKSRALSTSPSRESATSSAASPPNWPDPVRELYAKHPQAILDYSWERLYDGYRLCAAMGVYIATEYCRGRVNERWIHRWMPTLKNSLTVCDDLDCSALW